MNQQKNRAVEHKCDRMRVHKSGPKPRVCTSRPGLTLNQVSVDWRAAMQSTQKQPRHAGTPCRGCGTGRSRRGENGYCGHVCWFWSNVDKGDACWAWQGAVHNSKGYGRVNALGERWLAHRLSYVLAKGPIPDKREVDHLCKNTRCVNPDHLEAVTAEEHAVRSDQGAYLRARTHCPQGHEYTTENTRISGRRRHCRSCGRMRSKGNATTNSTS